MSVLCNCGVPASQLTSTKDGPNKGREFYGCPNYAEGGGCGFFQWKKPQPKQKKRELQLAVEGSQRLPRPVMSPDVQERAAKMHRDLFNRRQAARLEQALEHVEKAWELIMEALTKDEQFME